MRLRPIFVVMTTLLAMMWGCFWWVTRGLPPLLEQDTFEQHG